MAYNYFPNGYQPYYQAQNNTTGQNAIIWVQGEAAAKSYPVAPNSSVALWDSEANVIYVKSADMSGMPSLKILDYKMRDSAPQRTDFKPQGDFATKEDVEYLKGEIMALKAKFEVTEDGKRTVQSDK